MAIAGQRRSAGRAECFRRQQARSLRDFSRQPPGRSRSWPVGITPEPRARGLRSVLPRRPLWHRRVGRLPAPGRLRLGVAGVGTGVGKRAGHRRRHGRRRATAPQQHRERRPVLGRPAARGRASSRPSPRSSSSFIRDPRRSYGRATSSASAISTSSCAGRASSRPPSRRGRSSTSRSRGRVASAGSRP